ncbi:MAG TPA: DUF4190 domain-containing protein [Kofleriaceae bacterium]|nr:DUF4190 domain-containing protein [Kofleriaceae bacterium]
MAAPAGWYYGTATDRKGPVGIEQLKKLALARHLSAHTLVWSEGMPEWVPLGTIVHVPTAPAGDEGLGLLVPMGPQSALAMIAGYCGLFSILVIPAPFAIILGILGLRDIAAHPEKKGKGRAITGIVLGSLVTLLFLLILVTSRK